MDRERRQTHTQTRSNTYRKQDSSPKSNLRQRVKKIGQLSRHKVVERKRLKEESVTSFQRFVKLKPRKAVKQAKREYKRSAREVRQAKRQYRQAKQSGDEKRLKITKERLNELKEKRKVAKKVQSLAYRRNGGTLKRKLARKGYQSNRRLAESTVSEQETMGDIAQARQKLRRSKANYHQAKRIGTYAGKLGVESTKRTYGLTNRGYNFIRGRGFTRTAMSDRWEVKLAKRMRNFRHRLAASKAGKGIKGGWKVTKILMSPIRSILANPLSIKSYLLAFFLLMFLALFMGGSSPMSQSEEDLNKTWLHLSKLDREFSDETVDYWTNIDDVVHFMNYRYEDFSLGDKVEPEPSAHEGITYDLFLGVIWKGLNDDVDNLKTMSDLYGKKDSKVPDIVLSENELEEYQELLELAEETGRYLPYQELSNPFSTDDEITVPLLITKRYGYVSPSEIYKGTVLQVQNGHNLYAVMSGEVEVKGDTVIIKADGAEFTYAKVGQIRVTSGDVINEGELIGKVSSSEGQEVFYQKLSDGIIDTWEYVNPGFYFEHTAYNQTTSIIRPLDLSGDIGSRIQQAANLIKKYEPKATMQGISAMLGNFWTESNITAKRAEGDYLSPPVGASETSWDDPNWLSLGGMAIYGKYPNIIHRGLGLGQWTDTQDGAIRHTLLLNYAKEKGKKWYDLELQIDFIFNGDSPYYRQTARDILTNSANVETLTQRFLIEWEGNSGDKLAERQNNANQVYQHLKNPAPANGDFVHPFKVPYVVLQPYGYTPWSTGAGAFLYTASGGKHTGVDIQAFGYENQDIPIYSMTNGKVVYSGWSDLGGNAIVIETDFGGYLYYGHNKYASPLAVGTKVTKGQQIAILGASGMTNIYHIHLEYTTQPTFGTGVHDKDPSFLFQKSGTLQQNQVIKP